MSYFTHSSVQSVLQPIDCRRLTLSAYYYFLDQDTLSAMMVFLLKQIEEIVDSSFVFRWYCNGKSVPQKRVIEKQNWEVPKETGLRVSFDAYVKNATTHSPSAILQYQKKLPGLYAVYQSNAAIQPYASDCSLDFPECFDNLFGEHRLKNDQIIDNILKIFHTKNRKLLSFHKNADLFGHIQAHSYRNYPEAYYGSVALSFSAFCANSALDDLADRMARLSFELSEKFKRLNIQVSLQPYDVHSFSGKGAYMRYFGKSFCVPDLCKEAGCSPEEWNHTYYMHGVEWLNVLSPLSKQHIGEVHPQKPGDDIRQLSSDSLLIKSQKPITSYGIEDSLMLKKIIQPALYPGCSTIPLRAIYPSVGMPRVYAWCPCSDWAIVPIEQGEVDIVGNDIFFQTMKNV